jgi:hypothetical protein
MQRGFDKSVVHCVVMFGKISYLTEA